MIEQIDILARVRGYAGALRQFGTDTIDDDLLTTMISQGVSKYSKDSPQRVTATVSKLTMPKLVDRHIFNTKQLPNWEPGFSFVYNVLTQDVPPLDVTFQLSKTGYLYLDTIVDLCIVEYAIPHILTSTVTTIPLYHDSALVYLSLSELCDVLSLRYEHGLSRPIQDVDVNFDTRATDLRKLSQMYLEKYYSELGGTKYGVTIGIHDQHKVSHYDYINRNRRINKSIERV